MRLPNSTTHCLSNVCQVKKWFANKRARTSNNGLPKPLPPTASDTPVTAAADTSAFVAAAVAAAAAANGGAGVVLQSQQVPTTTTSSILVSSGLMIRPNGAPLSGGGGGLTILAPRPSLSTAQLTVVTPAPVIPTGTTATSSTSEIREESEKNVPSTLASQDATIMQQSLAEPTPLSSPANSVKEIEEMDEDGEKSAEAK